MASGLHFYVEMLHNLESEIRSDLTQELFLNLKDNEFAVKYFVEIFRPSDRLKSQVLKFLKAGHPDRIHSIQKHPLTTQALIVRASIEALQKSRALLCMIDEVFLMETESDTDVIHAILAKTFEF